MRRRLTWLALTVLSGVALGALLLAFLPQLSPGPAPSPSAWEDRLARCLVDSSLAVSDEPAKNCAFEVMRDAVDARDVAAMLADTDRLLARFPQLLPVCHAAGHRAGQYAVEAGGDPVLLLRDTASTACAYAMGHGVLDGFALTSPSPAEFTRMISACEAFQETQGRVFTACADGTGHAAWTSTGDFAEAFGRCDGFAEPGPRSLCAEGVVMQVYEPAGVAPSRDISRASSELPHVCTDEVASPESSLGCASGAGYLYSRPWWALESRISGGAAPAPEDSEQLFVDVAEQATRDCSLMPGGLARACARGVVAQLPPSVQASPPLRTLVCAPLRSLAPYCDGLPPG